ncbi:MAG: hypothetical protein ACXWWX_03505 [Actinomycetota bacterium]
MCRSRPTPLRADTSSMVLPEERSRTRLPSPRLLVAVSVLSAAMALTLNGAPRAAPAARADAWSCGEGLAVVVDGSIVCTHDGDRIPLVGTVSGRALATTPPKAPCPGNGKGGRRVVVAYGYPADTQNRSRTLRPTIRQAINMADANLDAASAGIAGQHYRFYCQDDKRVTILTLALVPIGGDGAFTFNDMISSLSDRVANGLGDEDLDDPRRVYSVFVDNVGCCYGPGGQATLSWDDRADPGVNWNNQTFSPKYSMIKLGHSATSEAGIWQHEVGHNLGAVQNSAPHTSGAGHCYEGYDVMCYSDGGPWFTGGGGIVNNCVAGMPDGQEIFDCNGDDYYSVAPADGSYLATSWNLSSSRWLSWSR